MAKMHELLAVEASVLGNYNRDIQETHKVFERGDAFKREVTSKAYFDSADTKLNTTETKEITTTVDKRLSWISKSVTDLFDLVLQKDKTNQVANADIEVDGVVLVKNVPATTLLMLESRLQDLRKVLEAAPTLPSGQAWEFDSKEELYKAVEPVVSFSTKKTMKPVVLYAETDKHPAQVEKVFEDVPVAKVTKETYAGMITSADKAKLLSRLDAFLQAAKKARMRANSADAAKDKIGDTFFKYLYDGIIKNN
jgi:hypothetical protein